MKHRTVREQLIPRIEPMIKMTVRNAVNQIEFFYVTADGRISFRPTGVTHRHLRAMGSIVKQERLSKLMLLGESSLRRTIVQYVKHYHEERNHQGKNKLLLFPAPGTPRRRRTKSAASNVWRIASLLHVD